MLLRIANSPISHPFQATIHFHSPSSFAQTHLLSRPPAPIPRLLRIKVTEPIRRASISQVHNYGETVDHEKRPALKWTTLYRRISMMENPSLGSAAVLEKWDEEEKRLSKWVLSRVAKELRKFGRYKLALEIYEWMIAQGDRFKFTASEMAIQLDLISKAHSISQAEEYFSSLSDELKDKRTCGALLNAYGKAQMKEKAEALLETMKDKGLVEDSLPYNVMMTLYMNVKEHEKVNATINEMEEKNVPFDVYTYNIWMTNCSAMSNIGEMERVKDRMLSDTNTNPNWTTYSILANMYIKANDFGKAENCLKEIELRITGRDRIPFHYLLGYYSGIGKKEEVYRIWKLYKSNFPNIINTGYQIILSSLVRLEDVDGAEAIYDEWLSTTSNYDPRICNILIGGYARKGLVEKAKALLDGFVEKGGKPKPVTWEILAEGYILGKQVSEALSCMKDAASCESKSKWRPKLVNVENIVALCKEFNKMEDVDVIADVLRNGGCLE